MTDRDTRAVSLVAMAVAVAAACGQSGGGNPVHLPTARSEGTGGTAEGAEAESDASSTGPGGRARRTVPASVGAERLAVGRHRDPGGDLPLRHGRYRWVASTLYGPRALRSLASGVVRRGARTRLDLGGGERGELV